jgi:uncharacterized protein (TIGR02145 family)
MLSGWKNLSPGQNDNDVKQILIGTQTWTTQNLNTTTFRNGDTIPHARTMKQWKAASWKKQPAWCYYQNDSNLGRKYGRLYNFYAVNDPRGLAPAGWHIPTAEEWYKLCEHLGGRKLAGEKMKSTQGWFGDENGTNSSGFTALPCGSRTYTLINQNNGFQGHGKYCMWWSTNLVRRSDVCVFMVARRSDELIYTFADQSEGLPVRCVKD